eukprot:1139873-Pelagomonas_calceolata.AAC.2
MLAVLCRPHISCTTNRQQTEAISTGNSLGHHMRLHHMPKSQPMARQLSSSAESDVINVLQQAVNKARAAAQQYQSSREFRMVGFGAGLHLHERLLPLLLCRDQ